MCILIVGCFVGAAYLINLMHEWTSITRLQLTMDECVGKKAITLKKIQNEIETLNTTIDGFRASAIVSNVIIPGSGVAIQASIQIAILAQDFELTRWKAESIRWFIESCSGSKRHKIFKTPLPSLRWERLPPDALGGQPLKWVHSNTELNLKMAGYPRFSAAKVFKLDSGKWESAWSNYNEKY
jgi:hypothetical protein